MSKNLFINFLKNQKMKNQIMLLQAFAVLFPSQAFVSSFETKPSLVLSRRIFTCSLFFQIMEATITNPALFIKQEIVQI